MNDHNAPLTISVPEAGERYFGLCRNAAYNAAARGEIPTIRIGRLLRVPVLGAGAHTRSAVPARTGVSRRTALLDRFRCPAMKSRARIGAAHSLPPHINGRFGHCARRIRLWPRFVFAESAATLNHMFALAICE
jgi:hypothetical protein